MIRSFELIGIRAAGHLNDLSCVVTPHRLMGIVECPHLCVNFTPGYRTAAQARQAKIAKRYRLNVDSTTPCIRRL